MNKVINLKNNRKEVFVTLLIYVLLFLFSFIAEARFNRLGLNTNYISNENVSYFVSR